jgi:hypothetical protein
MIDSTVTSVSLRASCVQACGRAVEAVGYSFYGYWFSHSGV